MNQEEHLKHNVQHENSVDVRHFYLFSFISFCETEGKPSKTEINRSLPTQFLRT